MDSKNLTTIDMRSIFKNEKYFEKYIAVLKTIIDKNENRTFDDEVKNSRMKILNASDRESLLIASYSSGLPICHIRELFSDTVNSICKNWTSEIVKFRKGQKLYDQLYVYHHDTILRVISIGVLLEDIVELKKIKNLLYDLKINNRLFDKLIKYKIPDHQITKSENSFCPTAFNKIEKLAFQEPINEKKLINFQKNWYALLNKNYFQWKDTHLNNRDSFRGYWSFSTAAIAKVNALNSEKLTENIFFPTDLFLMSDSHYQYHLSNHIKLLLRIDELICKMGGIRRSTNEILSLRKDILKMKKPKYETIENTVNTYIQRVTKNYSYEFSAFELDPYIENIQVEMIKLKHE